MYGVARRSNTPSATPVRHPVRDGDDGEVHLAMSKWRTAAWSRSHRCLWRTGLVHGPDSDGLAAVRISSGVARTVLKESLLRAGVRVERSKHALVEQRQRLLSAPGTDLVVDVGAAEGQYGRSIRKAGYRGPILSAEPRSASFHSLQAVARADEPWSCIRTAIAPRAGEQPLVTTAGAHSSSLLRPVTWYDETHARDVVGEETVPCERLDALPTMRRAARAHVKVDVQGAELGVISSATAVLDRIRSWEVELSLVLLYEGQALIEEVIGTLRNLGFTPIMFERGYTRPSDGRVLQVDALFTRDSAAE